MKQVVFGKYIIYFLGRNAKNKLMDSKIIYLP